MTNNSNSKLKYQVVLDEFLKERGWTDEYEVDTEEQSVFLDTQINISMVFLGV